MISLSKQMCCLQINCTQSILFIIHIPLCISIQKWNIMRLIYFFCVNIRVGTHTATLLGSCVKEKTGRYVPDGLPQTFRVREKPGDTSQMVQTGTRRESRHWIIPYNMIKWGRVLFARICRIICKYLFILLTFNRCDLEIVLHFGKQRGLWH